MSTPEVKHCRDCVRCIGCLRVGIDRHGLPRLYPDEQRNVCAHPEVLISSPQWAAARNPPTCIWARRVGGVCGLAGALFKQKPPEPVKIPPPSRVPTWRRLLSWLHSAAPV